MKLSLVVLLGFLATSYAVSFFEVVVEEWEAWKTIHRKDYNTTEEEKFRMKIYMENKQRIAKHNTRYYQGHHNYKLEMNHYGDLLPHEFSGMMNGFRQDLKLLQGANSKKEGLHCNSVLVGSRLGRSEEFRNDCSASPNFSKNKFCLDNCYNPNLKNPEKNKCTMCVFTEKIFICFC